MVLISFVITIVNDNLEQLFQCVESILSLDFNDYEILLKDSSEKIVKDIKKILKDEKKINFIKLNEENAIFKNSAIDNAIGDYLCFLNSNEIINSDSLSTLNSYLLKNTDNMISMNYSENESRFEKTNFVNVFEKTENKCFTDYGLPVYLSKNIIRKEIIQDKTLKFADDSQDSEFIFLWNLLKEIQNFTYIPLNFIKNTNNKNENNKEDIITFLKEYEHLLSLISSEEFLVSFENIYEILTRLKEYDINNLDSKKRSTLHKLINNILNTINDFPKSMLKHELKIYLLYLLDQIDNAENETDILVSVIIPTYNVEKYLDDCLNSLINQSLKDIEIILVDDCSTDSTTDIISYYENKDNRIKSYLSKDKLGCGGCRNVGLKLARGKYIQFVDSDDWLDLDALEKMYNVAENLKTQVILFKVITYDENEKAFKRTDYYDIKNLKGFENKVFNILDLKSGPFYVTISAWNKFYLKSFLDRHNAQFPENLIFEDNPFFFNVFCQANSVYLMDDYFYNRRIRSNSIITTEKKLPLNTIEIVEQVLDIFLKNELYDYYKYHVVNYILFQIHKYSENIPDDLEKEFISLAKNKIYKFMFDYELYDDFLTYSNKNNRTYLKEILGLNELNN